MGGGGITLQRSVGLLFHGISAHPLENERIIVDGRTCMCKSFHHIVNEGSNQLNDVFYITNFLEDFELIDLRKGLEVCWILSDIFVSIERNIRGQIYGFVFNVM